MLRPRFSKNLGRLGMLGTLRDYSLLDAVYGLISR